MSEPTKEQLAAKGKALATDLRRAKDLLVEVRRAHRTAFFLTREPGPRERGLHLMEDIDTFLKPNKET